MFILEVGGSLGEGGVDESWFGLVWLTVSDKHCRRSLVYHR